jgi:hypothetical protein
VQLLQLAVAALAAGLVPLPDDRRVAVAFEPFQRRAERRIPAPAVGADDPHALLHQMQRRLAAEAAAAVDVVLVPVPFAGPGCTDDDLERRQHVADPLKLGVDLIGSDDVPIGLVAKVESHPGLHAPVERDLVDRARRLTAVHRRVVMPRGVHVGAVVGRDPDALDRPPLAVGQLLDLEPGECGDQLLRPGVVIDVLDRDRLHRRIGGNVVGQRD